MTTASIAAAPTRTLLTCGAAAAPLWAGVSLAQAFTREGFDLTHDPLSLLSTGPLGWIQIANFLVAGVLMIAGAAGLRTSVPSTWAPRLLTVAGAGMVAAGVFTMDPPSVTTLTWHSYAHFAAGTITFVSLIAACYVLARAYARAGRRGHAVASAVAGTALLLGDGWAMSGGTAGSLTLAIGAISAMLWVSAVCADRR